MATRTTNRLPPLVAAPQRPQELLGGLLAAHPALLRREEHVAALARAAGQALQPLGTQALFAGYRRYEAEPHDWVLLPLADDPLLCDADGYPMPRAVLRRLVALRRAGVDFDALYVAHEVRKGALAPGEAPRAFHLAPGPSAAATRESRWLARASAWVGAAALLPAACALAVGAAAGATVVGAASAGGMSLAALDPVILGAIVAPGCRALPGEPARWFMVARWAYEEAPPSPARRRS